MTEFAAYYVGGCFSMFVIGYAAGSVHKFFTQAMDQV